MIATTPQLRKRLYILLVILFSLGSFIYCRNNYLNFYAGYPLRNLEQTTVTQALNRYLAEVLFAEEETPFSTEIIHTANTEGTIAILFSDVARGSFCGIAEIERGPFGRYRMVRVQAGEAAGSVQLMIGWNGDFGFVYSMECFPEIESYGIAPDSSECYSIPPDRTFIQFKPLSGSRQQLRLFGADGTEITKELPDMQMREYTIGNPTFFAKTAAVHLLISFSFCAALCFAVWYSGKRSKRQ